MNGVGSLVLGGFGRPGRLVLRGLSPRRTAPPVPFDWDGESPVVVAWRRGLPPAPGGPQNGTESMPWAGASTKTLDWMRGTPEVPTTHPQYGTELIDWDGSSTRGVDWKRPYPPVVGPGPQNPAESVEWAGGASLGFSWQTSAGWTNYSLLQREGYEMIQLSYPVRANTPQLMTHTFRDQQGQVIDLTSYVSVALLTKFQGAVYASTAGAVLSPPTAGKVQATAVPFPSPNFGVWDAQFVCTDAAGKKLYGEPIRFKVVKNVDDLALAELPDY